MKIRVGFVSNSSSSSFCIYGFVANYPKDIVTRLSAELQEEVLNDAYALRSIAEKVGLDFWEPPSDDIYIGIEWSSIGDDETGREFKQMVFETIKEIIPDIREEELGTYAEGWYDG